MTLPRRRVLLVGRNRYRLPLDPSLRRKFDALERLAETQVLGSAPSGAATGDGMFTLVPPLPIGPLDGVAFYLALPFRVARALRRFPADAVIAQSAYEAVAVLAGRAIARSSAAVVVDVHGDWRTSTRLYGAGPRKLLAPLGDALASAAIRRADAVRTITAWTTRLVRDLGVEPAAEFPAYMDLAPFTERPLVPLPDQPAAIFIGVLEPYKNIDGLADAWRLAAPRLPGVELHLVGQGTRTDVVERLLVDIPAQTRWTPQLTTPEVAEALDRATVLVLPSRSEGMGRVVVEALCRARPVIGSKVGGIRDLVEDGRNGILIDPADVAALAEALVAILADPERARRLSVAARESAEPWIALPDEYAQRTINLVEIAVAARRSARA